MSVHVGFLASPQLCVVLRASILSPLIWNCSQDGAHETEEQRLKAENERLKAENDALRQAQAAAATNESAEQPTSTTARTEAMAEIPARPHTTDPDEFARNNRHESEPPAGASLETVLQWREKRGKSAVSRSSSQDFGPPRLLQRSWLTKTPLSTMPNPVRS